MNISTVNELIQSLESAGELSIKETKVMELAKAYQQLAAENLQIKAMNDCLSEELRGYESDGAFEGPKMHLLWWQVETPSTDSIVAGIKADGVEEFIGRLQQHVDEGDFVDDEVAVIVGAIDCGKEFCEQLREGVK
ncbi:hypothetical protein N6B35_16545 [Klebsiella michiganensis]|uniref:hypothetical protein n=1 Tax=Klebsiella michiganensis TaxID=1134687 RepID=UPI0021D8460C|nr:hypothetical protein [Klebsiella michiganensis]UYB54944.1 hypothetical protein N6B35_16545 [Klebsiella michiganensis]